MDNFEMIDDYLSNRLSEQERKAFEQKLDGDPALKEEVDFQQQVVEGVRSARAAELKTMLKNVPVSNGGWSGGKIAATIVSAGIVATGLYFYFQDEPPMTASVETVTQPAQNQPAENSVKDQNATAAEDEKKDEKSDASATKERSKTVRESTTPLPVQTPTIKVEDPSEELTATEEIEDNNAPRSEISVAKMEVITDSSDKKHTFHYQFVDGKLMLYGPFDKNLYEILEIHGVDNTVFLFYKENYYLLNERQSSIIQLEPIRDGQLLKKLKEYRVR